MAAPTGIDATENTISLGDETRELNSNSAASLKNDVDAIKRKIAANGLPYDRLKAMALDHLAMGRKFSPQLWREWVADHEITDANGKQYGISNDDVAIYVRLLVEDLPEVKKVLALRKSRYDSCFRDPHKDMGA
jgi:hypothetical protein